MHWVDPSSFGQSCLPTVAAPGVSKRLTDPWSKPLLMELPNQRPRRFRELSRHPVFAGYEGLVRNWSAEAEAPPISSDGCLMPSLRCSPRRPRSWAWPPKQGGRSGTTMSSSRTGAVAQSVWPTGYRNPIPRSAASSTRDLDSKHRAPKSGRLVPEFRRLGQLRRTLTWMSDGSRLDRVNSQSH
jgi:hypothetical protein